MIEEFSKCYKIEMCLLDTLKATRKYTVWPFIRKEWEQARIDYMDARSDTVVVWMKLHKGKAAYVQQ